MKWIHLAEGLPEELLLFDIDGTLVEDYNSAEPLPGRREFFESIRSFGVYTPRVAFITNQGGVNLNWWLVEQGKDPGPYPSLHDVSARLNKIFINLGVHNPTVYINYCYQTKDGNWLPTPYDMKVHDGEKYVYTPQVTPDEWSRDFRKPAPGMIDKACWQFGVKNRGKVLYVGDRPEDLSAAVAAQVEFMWAKDFFMD